MTSQNASTCARVFKVALQILDCTYSRVFEETFYLFFDPITPTEQTNMSLSDCETIEAFDALMLSPALAILVGLCPLDRLEELEQLLTRVSLVPRWLRSDHTNHTSYTDDKDRTNKNVAFRP